MAARRRAGRAIEDHEVLTQCGRSRQNNWKFNNVPRDFKDPPEVSLSLVLGRLDPQSAVRKAFGRAVQPDDAVRETTAGTLREAGFMVEHTPSRANPDHCSVYWDGQWNDDVAKKFDLSFGLPGRQEDFSG